MNWEAFAWYVGLFLAGWLFAEATQPLPDGGMRCLEWWDAFRAMFRRRRRPAPDGPTGPTPPLHPNCRCIVEPIEDAMNRDTQHRNYAPSKPADQAPAIDLKPVESSQLAAYGYDDSTATLAIRFHGSNGKPGSLYHYANFSETDFAALEEAASKGSHFLRAIKPHTGRFPCTRIIETPAG